MDSEGRTIWIADAHRDDGKRFVVRADEKLTAFFKLESAISAGQRLVRSSTWPMIIQPATAIKTAGFCKVTDLG